MKKACPDTIRISYGTAIVLGLIKARQEVAPTTAYLLFDDGCQGSCSFCPRANGNSNEKKLSRIIWPEFKFDDVLTLLSATPKPFKRVCLQTGYNPANEELIKNISKALIDNCILTSVTLSPGQTDLALELLDSGIDHIGIGLDCVTPKTYSIHKKRNWDTDWEKLLNLMHRAKGKIEVHLIYGFENTEEDFCRIINQIADAGGKISLFALTPVNGGISPEISEYRRVQIFRYLCENGNITIDDCIFEKGKLKKIKAANDLLIKLLDGGDCFRTSGCGDCNRPFYNEKPGQTFFNYPRPLTEEEFQSALLKSGLF
ncbi:MAG: radical SAM protein [Candidatus Rifleibacteriota bacterium]